MTLAIRVIPILLKRDDSLVKGRQFNSWRVVGHPLQAARIHAARGVDELVLLDIGATPQNKAPDFQMIEKLTASAFHPITVGGGVRSIQDVRDLLNAGADRIAIHSHPQIVEEVAGKFGSQAISVSIDVMNGLDPVPIALQMEKEGAGEILLQCVERDGMMEGYDLDSIRRVTEAVSIPVIASCGAGTYEHMAEAIRAGASAVAAGAMFQFSDATPKGASQYMSSNGLEARCD